MSGCASTPPDEDPVQIKLKDLDTRLVRIERVMANKSLLEVSNQLEALSSDVRAMHNDVDQLSNALESSRKQQRDMYADLDQRLKNLESRGSAAAAGNCRVHGRGRQRAAAAAAPPRARGCGDKLRGLRDGQSGLSGGLQSAEGWPI